jgi:preprotein translocase subunit SecA
MLQILQKIVGSKNERSLSELYPIVSKINSLESEIGKLNDDLLKEKTKEFKERIERGESLDLILPEAFAVVRETAKRKLGERHFDCQILGGICLHQGKIVEMATGEGKTLVATLPAYLNALEGKGVHIVTVNDYLAKRDMEWMGAIYEFLGISVNVIYHDMEQHNRKNAYQADITFGTNTEFGFDYLRDNMAMDQDFKVQREHNFVIVDEVDSILIDESRTPLIISGPIENTTQKFHELKPPVERLIRNQISLMNKFISQAETLIKEEKEYEAGIKLLQVKRGAPKNKRFLKIMKESKYKKLLEKVELDCIRDKRLPELDADLYFSIEEKSNVVDLTDEGRHFLSPNDSDFFVLPDLSVIDEKDDLSVKEKESLKFKLENEYADKAEKIQNISQLLKSYSLFEKDVDYVVSDGKVLIVDEFTGRLLPGRRYSDGLHQALEAKEGVTIEGETQTLATITIQNYFRLYKKLSGMTGTAETESPEFLKIYKLDVVVIPTNKPVRRIDYPDIIYKTKAEKYRAVINEIADLHKESIPVLVGTTSVEVSEKLSRMLGKRIKHSVLNAKRHKEEAEIIANAGQPGAVTIATNMAGRGTDIKLGPGVVKCTQCCINCEFSGGNCKSCPDEEKKGQLKKECFDFVPCGLRITGTAKHEARRIDRQLRGRSGRQGDPGASHFYLSLEDDLLRIFGSEKIAGLMGKLGMEENQPIEHRLITKAIENAQKKVEAQNFSIRKHLLEYDDVMNKQREVIYSQRTKIFSGDDLSEDILDMAEELIIETVEEYASDNLNPKDLDLKGLQARIFQLFSIYLDLDIDDLSKEYLENLIFEKVKKKYLDRKEEFKNLDYDKLEKIIAISVIDELWKEHLLAMDELKEGIGLRGYGQRDPLKEYQKEGFQMFTDLIDLIKTETLQKTFSFKIGMDYPLQEDERASLPTKIVLSRGEEDSKSAPIRRKGKKIGRNEPCTCGSGKKYKKCCGI